MPIEKYFDNKIDAAKYINEKNLLCRGFDIVENTVNGRTYIVLSSDESEFKTAFKIIVYAIIGIVSKAFKDLLEESIAVWNNKRFVYKLSCPEEKQNKRTIEDIVGDIKVKVAQTNRKLSDDIKEKITNDFALCKLDEGYEGKQVKVFYSIRYTADFPSRTYLSDAHLIKNSPEDFQTFINTYVIEYFKRNIKDSYNDKHTIEIEILVVGQLKKLNEECETVDYQIFRQSYNGLKGDGHIGTRTEDLKESFLKQIPSYVRLPIWDSQGHFATIRNPNNNDSQNIKGVKTQSNSGSTASKTQSLSLEDQNPDDLSLFVHEVEINDEKKAKFNQIKFLYSKSIAGNKSPSDNCFLKFQRIGDTNKIWSLIDTNGENKFSIMMDVDGKLFAQTNKYEESLEMLIHNHF